MQKASRRALELLELQGAPQLLEGPRFDLPHPLPRDAEVLAGLRQRTRHAVVEAVADAQDLLLALAERAQQSVEVLVLELELDQPLDRGRRLAEVLGGELLEGLEPRAFVQGAQSTDERREALGASGRYAELDGDLVHARIATQARAHGALGAREAVHLLEHLHRDAERSRLLGESSQDGLANPDRRVRAEAQPSLRLEAIDRHDEPQIAFLDQVEQREPTAAIPARHVHHQPQVGEDDPLARVLVASARSRRDLEQFFVGQHGNAPDLAQIDVEKIALRLAGRDDRVARRGIEIGLRKGQTGTYGLGAELL